MFSTVGLCQAAVDAYIKVWTGLSLLSGFSGFQAFWSSFGPFLRSVQIWWEKLFEGDGVGVLEYSDPILHWNASFVTPVAKKSRGGGPTPALKEDVSFGVHLTNTCIHYRACCYALSGFLVLGQADPCMKFCKTVYVYIIHVHSISLFIFKHLPIENVAFPQLQHL